MVALPEGSGMSWAGNDLTEHNRSEIEMNPFSIETSTRTANGSYRRWVTARKWQFSVSWTECPSLDTSTVDGNWGGENMEAFYLANADFQLTIRKGGNDTETYQVVITEFNKKIVKRSSVSDLWDIDVSLEEV